MAGWVVGGQQGHRALMPVDYSKYPPNWRSQIVPRIRARAGECCESCGLANRSEVFSVPIKAVGRIWVQSESDATRLAQVADGEAKRVRVVLTIAHLDHDEGNHAVADERLMAMCQWCHLRYDAAEKARRRALSRIADQRRPPPPDVLMAVDETPTGPTSGRLVKAVPIR